VSLAKGTGVDYYGQKLDSFDDVDGTSATRGLSPTTFAKWHITADMSKAVEVYLDSKGLDESVALYHFMRECESGPLPTVRSRTSTDPMPWLQQPGAGRVLAQQWWAELAGGRL
jgi:hypothetical protein